MRDSALVLSSAPPQAKAPSPRDSPPPSPFSNGGGGLSGIPLSCRLDLGHCLRDELGFLGQEIQNSAALPSLPCPREGCASSSRQLWRGLLVGPLKTPANLVGPGGEGDQSQES